MKARPILFSAPMVQALLDGRKCQTRRIVNGTALEWLDDANFEPSFVANAENGNCPYGKPGDLLWLRETWRSPKETRRVAYRADGRCGAMIGHEFLYHGWLLNAPGRGDREGDTFGESQYGDKWKPSLHMPRWASRLTLEITGVRVERLQAITDEDCFAEGIDPETDETYLAAEHYRLGGVSLRGGTPERCAYAALWESINGRGSWDANTWVWVLSFKVHRCNVDELIRASAV